MSTTKPLVTVIGSTGAQGGSVCRALLADSTFRVRAITRKPTSAASLELIKLGVEIYQADINIASELDAAFAGSHALYALTDCWDPALRGSTDAEFAQGKGIADAAERAGVETVFYSGGPVIDTLPSPMCNAKTLVTEYFETKSFKLIGVNLGWYMTNWVSLFPPRIGKDGKTVEFAYPIFTDTFEFPMVATEIDTGPVILGILKSPNPERFWGKVFYLASEWVTLPQIASAYERATGQPARHIFLEKGDYDFVSGNSEWTNMNLHCVRAGGFAADWDDIPGHWEGNKLGPCLELHPEILTWEKWVKKSGFDMFDPTWQKQLARRPAEWDSQQ